MAKKAEEKTKLEDLAKKLKNQIHSQKSTADEDLVCFKQEHSQLESELETRLEFLSRLLSGIECKAQEDGLAEVEAKIENMEFEFERHYWPGLLSNSEDTEAEMAFCRVRFSSDSPVSFIIHYSLFILYLFIFHYSYLYAVLYVSVCFLTFAELTLNCGLRRF